MCAACVDPESFARGGLTFTFLGFLLMRGGRILFLMRGGRIKKTL